MEGGGGFFRVGEAEHMPHPDSADGLVELPQHPARLHRRQLPIMAQQPHHAARVMVRAMTRSRTSSGHRNASHAYCESNRSRFDSGSTSTGTAGVLGGAYAVSVPSGEAQAMRKDCVPVVVVDAFGNKYTVENDSC